MSTTVRRKRRSFFTKLKYVVQFGCLSVILALTAIAVFALYQVSHRLPTMAELGRSSAATRVFSSDGVLLARIYRENRDYVHLKDIPKELQEATVAIEDDRFYSHAGVDLRGIGRAFVTNIHRGKLGQGGSTITQQLARNAYDLGKQKTFSRKLQEAVVAMRLERRYSKQEILEAYLNEVFYGANAYGVQAASMQYFGKPAARLSLAECALIAGVPQRPTENNPLKNLEAATARRNVVLARMAELGLITTLQAKAASREPVRLAPRRTKVAVEWKAPYFVDYVIRQLENRYGPEAVYRGGLTVKTTLNYKMQKAAEEALVRGLDRSVSRGLVSPKTQAAITCVDPHNGYIRAMVGGRDYTKSQFNRAASNKRQLGSSFKPFVYAAALNEGWNQYRTVADSRRSWPGSSGKKWRPRNYDGVYRGRVSLRNAIAYSVNLAAINTAEAVGIGKCIDIARALGLKGHLPPHLPTAIGAGGGSTLEMASAYGAFTVKGKYIEPVAITELLGRDGNVVEQAQPQPLQVLRPEVADDLSDMLRAVVTYGTGRPAGAVRDAHGKTGTTNDDRDAWFVGYTPQLSTAVWVGNDDYTPMRHAYGGMACAPIWVEFMQKALPLNPRDRLDLTSPPGTVVPVDEYPAAAVGEDGMIALKICPTQGLIATNRCPHWNTRRFKPGEAPTRACEAHPGTALSTAPSPQPEGRIEDNTVVEPGVDLGTSTSRRRNAAPKPEQTEATAPAPATVVLCAETGLRANPWCPSTITRRLSPTTPAATCRVHGPGNQ